MGILVDTSVWIDYFRGGSDSFHMDALIDENILVSNEIILAELIPYLKMKKQTEVVKLLYAINQIPLRIDWKEIIDFQVKCLKNGANGVGIPDLVIAQNARQHNCRVYSMDRHFHLLNQVLKVELYQ